MFCDANFIYGLYNDCARTLKRSLSGKLAIVQLSSGFGFTRSSSRAPCALASFSRARMPRGACTRDVTCELYCTLILGTISVVNDFLMPVMYEYNITIVNIKISQNQCILSKCRDILPNQYYCPALYKTVTFSDVPLNELCLDVSVALVFVSWRF